LSWSSTMKTLRPWTDLCLYTLKLSNKRYQKIIQVETGTDTAVLSSPVDATVFCRKIYDNY